MNLNETQLSLIKEVITHVLMPAYCNSEKLRDELMEHFPDFIYDTLAYRALDQEWSDSFSNLSWSDSKQGALEGCKSMNSNPDTIYLYAADIIGFDLDLLIQTLVKTEAYAFQENFLRYYGRESEILCKSYLSPRLIEKITSN